MPDRQPSEQFFQNNNCSLLRLFGGKQLVWIEPNKEVELHGLRIKGGALYLTRKSRSDSEQHNYRPFAIDVDEKVILNEERSFDYRSGLTKPIYGLRSPVERGAFLRWLSGQEMDDKTTQGFLELYFSNIEYRALIAKHAPDEIILHVLLLFRQHQSSFRPMPFVRWVLFTTFQRPLEDFVACLEFLSDEGARPLGEAEISLMLTRLTQEQCRLTDKLAYLATGLYCSTPEWLRATMASEVRSAFLYQFKKEFPDGMPLQLPNGEVEVAYRGCFQNAYSDSYGAALTNSLTRTVRRFTQHDGQLQPLMRIWKAALDSSGIKKVRPVPVVSHRLKLDSERLRRIQRETEQSQAFLRERLSEGTVEAAFSCSVPTRLEQDAVLELAPKLRELLMLMTKDESPTFDKVASWAKRLGFLPHAGIQRINGWAWEKYGDNLVLQTEPFQINSEIKEKL